MIPTESFKIIFPDVSMLLRKDFELVDPHIVDPKATGVDLLYQGEWLTPMFTAMKLARCLAAPAAAPIAYPVFSLRGDYNIQFSKLVPAIMGNRYVADTLVFDRTPGVIAALGMGLAPKLQAFDGSLVGRSVLTASGVGDVIAAYVLELPGSATAPLRILGGY